MTTFSQTQEPTMDKSLAQEIRRNIKSWQKCRAEWIALAHSTRTSMVPRSSRFSGSTLISQSLAQRSRPQASDDHSDRKEHHE
jgi:hypothetical protein